MSTARTRPTREETRRRLFDAVASVFARHGVPSATVDQVVAEAGFTRGAFYSSFASKDELAMAMLEDHLAESEIWNRRLLADNPDPASFLRGLRAEGNRDDPLHTNPQLQVALMVHVAGVPELRSRLGAHLRTMRQLVGELASASLDAGNHAIATDPIELGTVLVALEDGLRLHQLIDPGSTPSDAFLRALELLQSLLLSGPPRA